MKERKMLPKTEENVTMRNEPQPTRGPVGDEKVDAFESHICMLEDQLGRLDELKVRLLDFLSAVHGEGAAASTVKAPEECKQTAESFFHRCSQLTSRQHGNLAACEEALERLTRAHLEEYEDQTDSPPVNDAGRQE